MKGDKKLTDSERMGLGGLPDRLSAGVEELERIAALNPEVARVLQYLSNSSRTAQALLEFAQLRVDAGGYVCDFCRRRVGGQHG